MAKVHFELTPATRTMDIYVDGVLVESVPMSASKAERAERLAAHGYVASNRTERTERGNGYGHSRSNRNIRAW